MNTVTVKQVTDWLNAIAPFDTAEEFDNVGLLMGNPDAAVHNVCFGMDLTEKLAQEALAMNAELIVTHHPVIFTPLRRIDYTTPQGKTLCALAAAHVNVLAAHTNWDKAQGGVSDSLAQALDLRNVTSGDDYLRIGSLVVPQTADALSSRIERSLHFAPRRYGGGSASLSRVAVAGGSYGEGAALAVTLGAQAFVVGEIKHHEVLDACARGLTVYEAGHFATELPGIAALYERFLADAVKASWQVKAHLHFQAPYAGATLAL
ncbi:MAG: Nif3-like dinuclear metal center hexameric protein [Clostridia bacterium]